MEMFFAGWRIVQQFINADARIPREAALTLLAERQIARELEMRRGFPVREVVAVLAAQAQPELLVSSQNVADVDVERETESLADAMLAPVARQTDG